MRRSLLSVTGVDPDCVPGSGVTGNRAHGLGVAGTPDKAEQDPHSTPPVA